MTDENAYNAPAALPEPASHKRRWLYRFVLLNALLIGFPFALAIAVYLLLQANSIQRSGASGSLGRDTMLFALGYVAIPNLVLVGVWRIEIGRPPRSHA